MIEPTFRPIVDKAHFPIIIVCSDLPCANLVACLDLVFYAPACLGQNFHPPKQYRIQRMSQRTPVVEAMNLL